MSFKGSFSRMQSAKLAGCIIISFSLKCTNLLMGETVDVALFPSDGAQPWFYRNLKFKSGQTYVFNFDTAEWNWCQGDYAAILDKKGKIVQRWDLRMKEYGPGECPECHGTHRCKTCHGEGVVYPKGRTWEYKSCPQCGGTGVCQTCYIPFRNPVRSAATSPMGTPYGGGIRMPDTDAAKQRRIDALRQRIQELQMKIERADWDERIMKLRGTDVAARRVYMSQVQLKYQYERQLADLQYELQQLESLR